MNKIYNILSGKTKIMNNTLVLYKNRPKQVLNKTIDFAKENNLDLITITDNILKIHNLLAGSEYDKILRDNISIYSHDYQIMINVMNFLKDHNHAYLIKDVLVSGRFNNIVDNIEDLSKIGNNILSKKGDIKITLNDIIDTYCPTVYLKGRDIKKTFDFLSSINLHYILVDAPSILINTTETIKEIYDFLKDEDRIDIIRDYPAVLSATDVSRLKEVYKYGKETGVLDKCVTMLIYDDNNVLTNDKLLKEYGIKNTTTISILKNNPNKLVDIIDEFIEREAYDAFQERRTILNMKYEKIEERTAFLKVNNLPVKFNSTGKLNPKIYAPTKEWNNYKLAGRKNGVEKFIKPIDIKKSNMLKKQFIPDYFLDNYINETDIRNMELTEEVIQNVDKYMDFLDSIYGVKNDDGTLNPLLYSVNGLIISRNKVKRNLSKLFYNDINLINYNQEVVMAAIFGISRYNEQEIEMIVNSVRSISLEKDDIKKPKHR